MSGRGGGGGNNSLSSFKLQKLELNAELELRASWTYICSSCYDNSHIVLDQSEYRFGY